jgi:hypothetical protein
MTQAIHSNASAASEPLAYASVAPPRVGPRAGAGAAILAAGVALVGLGGCFLIGVMTMVNPQALLGNPNLQPGMSGADLMLVTILYLLALTSFGGAGTLLFYGTRGLLRVMRGDWAVAALRS